MSLCKTLNAPICLRLFLWVAIHNCTSVHDHSFPLIIFDTLYQLHFAYTVCFFPLIVHKFFFFFYGERERERKRERGLSWVNHTCVICVNYPYRHVFLFMLVYVRLLLTLTWSFSCHLLLVFHNSTVIANHCKWLKHFKEWDYAIFSSPCIAIHSV